MLDIGVIRHAVLLLYRRVILVKESRCAEDLFGVILEPLYLVQAHSLLLRVELLQGLNDVLDKVARGLGGELERIVLIAARSIQPAGIKAEEHGADLIPALRHGFIQPVQKRAVVIE